ncbi:hypothetical protein HMPREF9056_01785 [Actinomyces sp. oral taxon 170 str. F0386]|nr:hypothetical protein HMPREF9056_01785 [Actinomyces sp. oral taxon 170 str. F0386]
MLPLISGAPFSCLERHHVPSVVITVAGPIFLCFGVMPQKSDPGVGRCAIVAA